MNLLAAVLRQCLVLFGQFNFRAELVSGIFGSFWWELCGWLVRIVFAHLG